MKKIARKKRGAFTLIETILAVTIIGLVVVSTTELTQSSLRIGANSMNQFIAFHLAEEGVEVVRNLRDSNWLQNRPMRSGLADGAYVIVEDANSTGGRFHLERTAASQTGRIIEIQSVPGHTTDEAIRVISTVYYEQAGGRKNVSLAAELTDWKKGPL